MRANIFYPFILIALWSLPVSGQWNTDVSRNRPLCVAPGWQSPAALLADGNRGAFAVWFDARANGTSGVYDAYAQHILQDGACLWTENGVKIMSDATFYMHFVLVPDGQDGFIVVYEKVITNSTGTIRRIAAIRVNHRGQVVWQRDPVFPINHIQGRKFAAISDGAGGAVVVQSFASEDDGGNILAQRIRATGALGWPAPGKMICDAEEGQYGPEAVLSANGFYYIAWEDDRNYQPSNKRVSVFLQRVNADGESAWDSTGVRITGSKDRYGNMKLIESPNGELTAVWVDARMNHPKTPSLEDDTSAIFAQRITPEGTLLWAEGGVHVSYGMAIDKNGEGDIQGMQIDTDHTSSVVIAWCNNAGMHYAQRLDRLGTRVFRNGHFPSFLIKNLSRSFYRFGAVGDMDGGMFLTYLFEGDAAVYFHALHVNQNGMLDWSNQPISRSIGTKDITFGTVLPHAVSDGHGGFLAAWSDGRDDLGDVYISRVLRNGTPYPVELVSFSGVRIGRTTALHWQTVNEANNKGFSVERSLDGLQWTAIGFVHGQGTSAEGSSYTFTDAHEDVPPSALLYYRLKQIDFNGAYSYSPIVQIELSESARSAELLPVYPNPLRDDLDVQISLPFRMPVTLQLVDALGKTVYTYTGEYSDGMHTRRIPMAHFPAGAYHIRLTTPQGTATRMLLKH